MCKANLNILAAVCIFIMTLTGQSRAVTHFVSPGQSIQAAIDGANNGDEIEVAPGTYNEAINFNGRAVRLYSSGGAEVTTINGTGHYHVVQCIRSEDADTILEGFTITGGNAASGADPNEWGGGMYNVNSSPTVTNCTFSGNSAALEGGGMYNSQSSPKVTNCIFSGNTAVYGGGGMENHSSSSPTVTNCIFIGNAVSTDFGRGGGMENWLSSSPTVTNCTFSSNTAFSGGGISNWSSSPTVTNCILWGDTPDEIDGSSTVSYSDIQGGFAGTGNINANPLFVDAAAGDWRLSSFMSPCVDTGNNSVPSLPATDLAGNPRVVDCDRDGMAVVDMGAYELPPLQIHNITQDNWYETIQVAIDDANDEDQIKVGPGTYNEAINFIGKAIRLYSGGGPEVTVIDAGGAGSVVSCVTGEGPNTVLDGFTITGGFSTLLGGGMLNESSSPTVMNCIFTLNDAEMGGGGMANMHVSSPIVKNCTFDNNITHRLYNPQYPLEPVGGGGIINVGNSSPTVANCIFHHNMTPHRGGGMANIEECSPVVTNCVFIENETTDFYMGDPPLGGGGMYNTTYSEATVTNCTFFLNQSMSGGGGLHNINGAITLSNCILWNDLSGEPGCNEILDSGGISANYCDIQGGWFGTGNINSDPLFIISEYALRLSLGSPCIDAGDSNSLPLDYADLDNDGNTTEPIPLDLDGNPRIVSTRVDMGAFEFVPPVHNITRDLWYQKIQPAIDDANNGDQIEVTPGIYNEAIDLKGKAVRLYSSGGPELTIIDGSGIAGAYHVVKCVSSEDANTILEGFTITGGNANGSSPDDRGGGMYNDNSSPTITSCIFTGNKATFGGGILNFDCNPTLTNCKFENNTASGAIGGGGMYNHNSSPSVTGCSFIGNSGAPWGGGGMFNAVDSNPTLINCTFINNSAVGEGGGIYNWNETMPILINCTFIGNSATEYGGGMFNINNSSPTVTNCILWGDTPDEINDVNSTPSVTYSDVEVEEGVYPGAGNINTDPCIVDDTGGNLRLLPGSPCIDSGDNTAVPGDVTADLNGFPRFIDDLCTPDTSSETAPVVDMGAYEYLPADIDSSGAVDIRDFCQFALQWLKTGCGRCGGANITCDGGVDWNDLRELLDYWLAGIEPEL